MEAILYNQNKYNFKSKEEFVQTMNSEMKNMKESFFKLGMYLTEAYVKK